MPLPVPYPRNIASPPLGAWWSAIEARLRTGYFNARPGGYSRLHLDVGHNAFESDTTNRRRRLG
jgi:hypothetical protein